MSGLVDFLLARVGEDEAVAGRWPDELIERPGGGLMRDTYGHPIYAGRSKVLAECEVKRRIIDLCTYQTTERVRVRQGVYEQRPVQMPNNSMDLDDDVSPAVLHALALPYADHPDYRQEWTP